MKFEERIRKMSKGIARTMFAIIFIVFIVALFGRCGDSGGDVDADENASIAQLRMINVDATKTKPNRDVRKAAKIKGASWYPADFHKKSWLICPNDECCGDFDCFKKRAMDLLQPKAEMCPEEMDDSVCEKLRARNTSIFLAGTCSGAYQTMFRLHAHKANDSDWDHPGDKAIDDVDWEGNLEFIHKFLNDQSLQIKVANGVIVHYSIKAKGVPDDICSYYYSKGNKYNPLDWLPSDGYGSKNAYGSRCGKCFMNKTGKDIVDHENDQDVAAMRKCLWKSETNGQAGSQTKVTVNKRFINKWSKRGVEYDLDKINSYEPPPMPPKAKKKGKLDKYKKTAGDIWEAGKATYEGKLGEHTADMMQESAASSPYGQFLGSHGVYEWIFGYYWGGQMFILALLMFVILILMRWKLVLGLLAAPLVWALVIFAVEPSAKENMMWFGFAAILLIVIYFIYVNVRYKWWGLLFSATGASGWTGFVNIWTSDSFVGHGDLDENEAGDNNASGTSGNNCPNCSKLGYDGFMCLFCGFSAPTTTTAPVAAVRPPVFEDIESNDYDIEDEI